MKGTASTASCAITSIFNKHNNSFKTQKKHSLWHGLLLYILLSVVYSITLVVSFILVLPLCQSRGNG